ncbi:MAG: nucleotidyltransferase family protein, partial [Anaerolineales bacterium]
VEMHWSLFDSPHYQNRLGLDWFWQARQRVVIDGVPASVPEPGAHLLYLAGHLWLHHQGQGLLWWNDLAELAAGSQGTLDWEQVLGWAPACDLVLPLQQVAAGLAGEWAVPFPKLALARLLALRPSAAEQRVFARLTSAERSAGRRLWVDLATMPGWGRRMRFAWSNLWPSPAYMRMRYNIRHGLLTPLYYPYRWLLGIRSALWKV